MPSRKTFVTLHLSVHNTVRKIVPFSSSGKIGRRGPRENVISDLNMLLDKLVMDGIIVLILND